MHMRALIPEFLLSFHLYSACEDGYVLLTEVRVSPHLFDPALQQMNKETRAQQNCPVNCVLAFIVGSQCNLSRQNNCSLH